MALLLTFIFSGASIRGSALCADISLSSSFLLVSVCIVWIWASSDIPIGPIRGEIIGDRSETELIITHQCNTTISCRHVH
jgi:hypothetical protein